MLRVLSCFGRLRRLLLGCQGQRVGQRVDQSVWHLGNPVIFMGYWSEGSDVPERDNPIATIFCTYSHYFHHPAKHRKKSC